MKTLFAFGLAFFAAMSHTAISQNTTSSQAPSILLNLPPDVESQTVRIYYFMIGTFGGRGGYVKIEKGRTEYEIAASVDGKPATTVKVIAYLPGCEFARFEVTVKATKEERTLACEPLGWNSLHGRISPTSITRGKTTEIEVVYLAWWENKFLGIFDGPVTSIHVATIGPDEMGNFNVELPDYYNQPDFDTGEFQFILRQPISGNLIAFLKPAEEYRGSFGLKVLSSYVPFVMFSADKVD